jgi:hemolysin activation/secretion protein
MNAPALRGRLFAGCCCLALGAFAARAQSQEPAPAPEPVSEAASEAAPAAFDVWEYRVLGNTVLENAAVERAVYPYLGKGKSFADVEAARAQLELAYRQAGYGTVFVDLPEQDVGRGIVRMRITEGRIDRVRVSGARYYSNRHIREALPSVTPGSVPKLSDVQAEINALNRRTAGRSVVPVLKAGRTPGTVDISLRVADEHPWHASLEVNDRYTAQTTKLRASVLLSYDNLFQRDQSLSFQYQTAPKDREDVEAMVASYVIPSRRWADTTYVLYGVDSKTDVAALGNINVLGNGKIFGARLIHSLQPQPDFFSSLTLGIDYKDFLENIQLGDDDSLVTPIRYLNWSVGYSGTRQRENGSTTLGATANIGMRRVVNDTFEFLDKRFKGAPNYFYVRANAQQVYGLPSRFQLVGRVVGQYSAGPLVSNEQIGIGGADTVRGYLESSQLGDYGFNGSLELRNDWLATPLKLPRGAAYFMLFYDAGVVAIQEHLPSQAARFDLASYGLGMRVSGWNGIDLAVDWAHALTPSGDTIGGDERIHFSMRYGF